MSAQDIRQGRNGNGMRAADIRQGRDIDIEQIISRLHRMEKTGMSNTIEDRETIRRAAMLLERAANRGPLAQAILLTRGGIGLDDDERTSSGLLEEN